MLYVDIVCLSYDGNITDAALIAAVAALKNSKPQLMIMNNDNNKKMVWTQE